MEKKSRVKLTGTIIIIVGWIVLLTGIIKAPLSIWMILLFVSIIFYIAVTKRTYKRKRNIKKVIEDMDEYMEKKAEEINKKELEGSDEKD